MLKVIFSVLCLLIVNQVNAKEIKVRNPSQVNKISQRYNKAINLKAEERNLVQNNFLDKVLIQGRQKVLASKNKNVVQTDPQFPGGIHYTYYTELNDGSICMENVINTLSQKFDTGSYRISCFSESTGLSTLSEEVILKF